MVLNGKEISFDLDNRRDNARFVKAFGTFKKARLLNDSDMEMFLRECLHDNSEGLNVLDDVLCDGKISTLVRIFTDFFGQAVEQFGKSARTYAIAAENLRETSVIADEFMTEFAEVS